MASVQHTGDTIPYVDPKTANEVLDYGFNWSSELEVGETITSSTWSAETGITIESSSYTDTETLVWLSGGTVNSTYKVTNLIVTSASPTEIERSFYIQIKDL